MCPIVSVIIPVRNCREYIGEAIESVLSQAFADFEVIVVDDGSDDFDYSGLELIDSRIRVIRQEAAGVSRARNNGIAQSCGLFVAFLDADDVWLPGKLAAQVSYLLAHPDVGVVFGRYVRWSADENGEFLSPSEFALQTKIDISIDKARSGWVYSRLISGLLVGMNTAVVRREIIDSIGGFDESLTHGEDYDFWLRCSRIGRMDSLNCDVALYRIHGNSAMHRLSHINHLSIVLGMAEMRWGFEDVDGGNIGREGFNKRMGEVHFMFGYSHFWHGNLCVARREFVASLHRQFLVVRSFAYIVLISLKLALRKESSEL